MASDCKCVRLHAPGDPPIELHHSPPKSYPLLAGSVRTLYPLCSNAHGIQHRLLNLMRAGDPHPPGFSKFHRQIAANTWANTDTTQPVPHTFTHE